MCSLCTAACVHVHASSIRACLSFRFWIGGPNASLPRHIPGTDQPLTLTPPDSESPLAAESVPIDASGLYKIAHSVDGNGSGKGNPATGKFTATTASEATDTA